MNELLRVFRLANIKTPCYFQVEIGNQIQIITSEGRYTELARPQDWVTHWKKELRKFKLNLLVPKESSEDSVFKESQEHRLLLDFCEILASFLHSQKELSRLQQENTSLHRKLGHREDATGEEEPPIVGANGGLENTLRAAHLVADQNIPVLLLGETGSGKEVIAREIHRRSTRKNDVFIRVNCGAISPELLDSELFGHEKSAFTGATKEKRGWFERAHGGTLFLDEIGELSPQAQVRLLRVLQDGTFYRVGGESERRVDVRIIAATHRDLENLVDKGKFRQDLWFRISSFPIAVPALRFRTQDIPELVKFFVERASIKFGIRCPPVSKSDLRILSQYKWPGNIRELAAVVDRAVLLGGGKHLALQELAARSMNPNQPQKSKAAKDSQGLTSEEQDFESACRLFLLGALERCRWRVEGEAGAAKLLNLNPNTLRSKMRRYDITRPC